MRLTVDPASAEPAEREDDVVEDDEHDGCPVGGGGRVGDGRKADVDQHADSAAESAPEHHGAAAELLDEPDWWVGGDGEDGVHDAGEDAGEHGRVAEVGEDLG
jgi:hypothetical protein